MRLFLAVSLPDEAREQIRACLPRSVPGRLSPQQNWHFTLRFLGNTLRPQLETLLPLLDAKPWGNAFTLRYGRLGAFPKPQRARVLWLGIDEGGEQLGRLARLAEEAARQGGFAPDDKPFVPHLTLSRMNRPLNLEAMLQVSAPCDMQMPVREVVLYRSHLEGGPPRYEALQRWPLVASS